MLCITKLLQGEAEGHAISHKIDSHAAAPILGERIYRSKINPSWVAVLAKLQ